MSGTFSKWAHRLTILSYDYCPLYQALIVTASFLPVHVLAIAWSKMDLSSQCQSQHNSYKPLLFAECGLYGEYTGPVIPPDWERDVIREEITKDSEDYPWVVHVRKQGRTLCTGTVIHQQWILTSQDCVSQIEGYEFSVATDVATPRPSLCSKLPLLFEAING